MDPATAQEGEPLESGEGGDSGDSLELVLVTREGGRYSGTLVDTSATAIVAAFPLRTLSALCIAEPVQIEYGGLKAGEVAQAAGRVVASRRQDGGCHYHLRVSENDAKAVSRARFRNRSLRIGVRGNERVELRVPGQSAEPVVGALRDISEGGMAIALDLAADRDLVARQAKESDPDWCLAVEFKLEGNERPLRMIAKVCYRALAAASVKYGLELVLDRTLAAYPGEPPRLTEHLLRYQSALLGSNRRSA